MNIKTCYLKDYVSPDVFISVCDRLRKGALSVYDSHRYHVLPGFCDVHVHLREPGFSYKETIKNGSRSCAAGGYTTVCAMPNLSPVPDSVENLQKELDLIKKDACIHIFPYGAITIGEKGEELSDLSGMSPSVIAFSDDGKGVQKADMMREAMRTAKGLGKMIVAHCEENTLLYGGYIHDGVYAKEHGHKGICSESEWRPIERDVQLARETGVSYHVCHISTKESVEIIRKAKAEGVDITCETAPHYLLMDDTFLLEDGRFKMNPPLRSTADREALLEAIRDGTIDMIATDHAPHSKEEKSRGLSGSAFGIVGIESAFPLLYTYLVRPGIITMEHLLRLLVTNPRKRFHLPESTDFSVWDLEKSYEIDPVAFVSSGKSTPFTGWEVFGRCLVTVCDGNVVYKASPPRPE